MVETGSSRAIAAHDRSELRIYVPASAIISPDTGTLTMDIPAQLPEHIVCSIEAATRYNIPANILLAVAEKEGGRPGLWVRNRNGTLDVGPLQFNTAYLQTLSRFGITAHDVAASGCYPYKLAAWRLRGHIARDSGDLWTRCANYHSRTPGNNASYRADLVRKAARWADWLAARYSTRNFTSLASSDVRDEKALRPSPSILPAAKSLRGPFAGDINYPAYVLRAVSPTLSRDRDEPDRAGSR